MGFCVGVNYGNAYLLGPRALLVGMYNILF